VAVNAITCLREAGDQVAYETRQFVHGRALDGSIRPAVYPCERHRLGTERRRWPFLAKAWPSKSDALAIMATPVPEARTGPKVYRGPTAVRFR
jgi:hypothetical protein